MQYLRHISDYLSGMCQGLLQLIRIAVLVACWVITPFTGNANTYYLGISGNDANPGTIQLPWRSVAKLNSVKFRAGDSILLQGGQVFEGNIRFGAAEAGTAAKPLFIGSYGIGKSVLYAGNGEAISLYSTAYIIIRNIHLRGAGRNDGNTTNGLSIVYSGNILVDSVVISGFQKSGLYFYSSINSIAQYVHAFGNGYAGISIDGEYQEYNSHDITLRGCLAENNPGDPSNLENHSGSGIVAGSCRKITIEFCAATNNGWDMPRTGNGPVGIWTYESDSVLIQYCISCQNKTSKGGEDGGGFDLDGGVKNTTIRNCLSYGNQGSGFGIFQYDGASYWYNNTITNCISENDGWVTAAGAGVYIWNSSEDAGQFHNLYFRNNIIYNDSLAAISYAPKSLHAAFYFYNNIFTGKREILKNWPAGRDSSHFICNNWWSINDAFLIDGLRDFRLWSREAREELQDQDMSGSNRDPAFSLPGKTTLKDPFLLKKFNAYYTFLVQEGYGAYFAP